MVLYEVKGFRSNDYICLSKLSSLIEPIAFLQAFCTCQKKKFSSFFNQQPERVLCGKYLCQGYYKRDNGLFKVERFRLK